MSAVVLPEDLEAWAKAEVAAGRAESVEQVVTRALGLWRDEQTWLQAQLDVARDEVARGEVIDGDDFLSELKSWIAEDTDAAA